MTRCSGTLLRRVKVNSIKPNAIKLWRVGRHTHTHIRFLLARRFSERTNEFFIFISATRSVTTVYRWNGMFVTTLTKAANQCPAETECFGRWRLLWAGCRDNRPTTVAAVTTSDHRRGRQVPVTRGDYSLRLRTGESIRFARQRVCSLRLMQVAPTNSRGQWNWACSIPLAWITLATWLGR